METNVYGNSVEDWLVSLAIIVGSFLLGKLIRFIAENVLPRLTAKTETKLDDVVVALMKEPMLFAVMLGGIWLACGRLTLPAGLFEFIKDSYRFLVVINGTWFVSRLLKSLMRLYLLPKVSDGESKLDEHAFSLMEKGMLFLVWGIGIITALNNAGVDVAAMIAGLGIGGVAIALAAQDTAKNIFGGVMILFDHPFRVGDLVEIDGITGFVEDIGMRSTKIRTYAGQLVVIPNYKTADSNLVNITREPARRVELNLGLTYDTQPEKMKLAMELLERLPEHVSGIEKAVKVYFNSYGDFSLNIRCWYYIKKESDLFETQSKVNLWVLEEFNKAGLEFAYPTQTIYSVANK